MANAQWICYDGGWAWLNRVFATLDGCEQISRESDFKMLGESWV